MVTDDFKNEHQQISLYVSRALWERVLRLLAEESIKSGKRIAMSTMVRDAVTEFLIARGY